jgi:hypothetical protein
MLGMSQSDDIEELENQFTDKELAILVRIFSKAGNLQVIVRIVLHVKQM